MRISITDPPSLVSDFIAIFVGCGNQFVLRARIYLGQMLTQLILVLAGTLLLILSLGPGIMEL
jgi:hypothetical protein